jgi:2-amino-4-hydroxy-6-hydroxymethyldihydropteridine diphosphokinase
VIAYLGLGANIGNREANLRAAVRALAERCTVVAVSSLYESAAVVAEGAPPGPDYLNAVCAVDTELTAHELLAFAKEVEHALGRRPAARWAARPIDIDVLLHGDEVIDTPELVVPHPRMRERNFVLAPLAEIAPDVLVGGVRAADVAVALGSDGLRRVDAVRLT